MPAPTYRLSELAAKLGVKLVLREGAEDIDITGVSTLEEAGPSDLGFLANPKYASQLATTKAGAVIVKEEHAGEVERALVTPDPYPMFAQALGLFAKPQGSFSGISHLACVDPSAQLGEGCTVYPFAYVGPRVVMGRGCTVFPGCYVGEDSELGDGCTLYPRVVLMAGTKLGEGCVLQPGAVIGAEGFGFARTPAGIKKVPQIGRVNIGDHVEIGANACVDRAALSATVIASGTCLDNLVQVGHNVRIGKDCLIVSQVGISGSTHVGDNVTMAGQAGISGHLQIGSGSTIGPQAGVAKDIPAGAVVGGSPTVDYNTYLRNATLMPKLPELFKRVSRMEKELGHKPMAESKPDRSLAAMWSRWLSMMHPGGK